METVKLNDAQKKSRRGRNIAIALRLLQKGLELGNEDARFFKNMSQRLIDEHLEAEDAATGQLV